MCSDKFMGNGGPAFPALLTGQWAGEGKGAVFAPDSTDGMSLRDWFAGMVLNGAMAAMPDGNLFPFAAEQGDMTEEPSEIVARECYLLADAMLAERDKEKPHA